MNSRIESAHNFITYKRVELGRVDNAVPRLGVGSAPRCLRRRRGGKEGKAPPAVARFAFVANLGNDRVLSAYTVNARTGQLRHNGYVVAGGTGGLTSVAVDPSNRFVYTTNTSGVWGFSVNATTGALTALTPTFVATAVAPLGIGIDPSGRYLYTVGAGATSNVLGFNIGANGILSPFASGPVSAGTDPRAITFDAGSLQSGRPFQQRRRCPVVATDIC